MGLYDRIVGRDDAGNIVPNRIAPEVFAATMSEFARGQINGSQARALLEALGCPFNDGEAQEAQTLLGTIHNLSTPEAKIARYLEIRDVLFLARLRAPGYNGPSNVRTRLGV